MPEQPSSHIIIHTSRIQTTYDEQTIMEYSRLEVHVVQHLLDAGIVGTIDVMGEAPRYSAEDLVLLRRVRRLYQDMGINLEGIEVILHLSARLDELQRKLVHYQELEQQNLDTKKQ